MESLIVFIYIAVFFVILYFLLIRPQQKQQKKRKEMLDSLRLDDPVVTIGGVHGKISKLTEDTITLKVAEKVELVFDKTAVGYVRGEKD